MIRAIVYAGMNDAPLRELHRSRSWEGPCGRIHCSSGRKWGAIAQPTTPQPMIHTFKQIKRREISSASTCRGSSHIFFRLQELSDFLHHTEEREINVALAELLDLKIRKLGK